MLMIAPKKLARAVLLALLCLVFTLVIHNIVHSSDSIAGAGSPHMTSNRLAQYIPFLMEKVEEAPMYDGKAARIYRKLPKIEDYDDLVFMTVMHGRLDEIKTDLLRAFVGGIHQLRRGRKRVPKIFIFRANCPADLPTPFREEVSWIRYLSIQCASEYLGLPIHTAAPKYDEESAREVLRLSLMEKLLTEEGHVLYIKFGYTVDPERVAIWRAEKQESPSDLLDAYGRGRTTILRFANEMVRLGHLLARQDFPIAQSNGASLDTRKKSAEHYYLYYYKPKDVVMEGYIRDHPGGHAKLQKRLHCHLEKTKDCTISSEEFESNYASDYGIFPYDPTSTVACHADVRDENVLQQAMLSFDSPYSLSDGDNTADGSDAPFDVVREGAGRNRKRLIAFGIPTTSKGEETDEPVLLRAFLPSLLRTVSEKEFSEFDFVIYLGYDSDDTKWDSRKSAVAEQVAKLIGDLPISLVFVTLPAIKRVAILWNILYIRALRDGADYFYQINDDVTMLTAGWATRFTQTLDRNSGLGVVGPADNFNGFNCTVLTQAMVTRRHYDVFGMLYPVELKDWKSDRWLTYVYQPADKFCFPEIIANNGAAATRYKHCEFLSWLVYLDAGRRRLAQYKVERKLREQAQ